jgi:hypothetical protein
MPVEGDPRRLFPDRLRLPGPRYQPLEVLAPDLASVNGGEHGDADQERLDQRGERRQQKPRQTRSLPSLLGTLLASFQTVGDLRFFAISPSKISSHVLTSRRGLKAFSVPVFSP